MGAWVSHGAWSGSYSSFNRWRTQVASAAGYWVLPIPKFSEGESGDSRLTWHYPFIIIDWGHIEPKQLQGEWDETPADPLMVLIAHSDCSGVLYPEQAVPLADRLEELLSVVENEGEEIRGVMNAKSLTEKFIRGLRLAVEKNEFLEFN